jgi:hypothetical protein
MLPGIIDACTGQQAETKTSDACASKCFGCQHIESYYAIVWLGQEGREDDAELALWGQLVLGECCLFRGAEEAEILRHDEECEMALVRLKGPNTQYWVPVEAVD